MRARTLFIAAAAGLASATVAAAAAVEHAGEWETTIDNRPLPRFCVPADRQMDAAHIMANLSKLPNAQCKMNSFTTLGPVTAYSMECTIGGSLMASSGTVTQVGPDAFVSKAHSHGGVIPMANGKSMAMPDMDINTTSHRIGACQPGDRMETQ